MKYQSSNTKLIYDVEFTKKNDICPECSKSRKKKNAKCLQYFSETNTAYCFNCNTTFFEYKPYVKQKQYIIPEWRNKTKLTDKAVKWFESRMISQDTLNKMKIFSDNEWMPQFEKECECMCFPFFVDEKQVNIKFRGPKKSFKLVSGAELVWYNFNALKENKEIIICEGEMDALTWIENGYDNVLSVPNGANKNTEYLDNSIKLFDNIEKIYLATDADTKGIELRDELIRRLGPEKCYLISFKQYKDSNEYFIGYGGIEFKKLIEESKPVPVEGIVKIESLYDEIIDLYENGVKCGLKINNEDIDKFVTWELGRLAIVTGVPGSGKSEFVDYLVSRLNLLHGWKVAYFTPENYPLKYHYRKIHEKYSGSKFDKKTDTTDFYSIYEYIESNYYYIMNEDDMKVDTILDAAKSLVKQNGIKILVIDPYNKLEHQYKDSETQYISRFLDKITNFAKFNNVLVFLVAHPRKMQRGEVPTLYDISGSANFYNKTDYGLTVHRKRDVETNLMINEVEVYWQKIKFKNLGEQGVSELRYNYNNGRFEGMVDIDHWDNSNWLCHEKQKEKVEVNFWNEIAENKNFDDEKPF